MEAQLVHEGDSVDYTPSADVAVGQVIVQGDMIGVASKPISANRAGAIRTTGVYEVAKASGSSVTFTAGQIVYWDDANNLAVETDDSGANLKLGHAIAAAGDSADSVRTRLTNNN